MHATKELRKKYGKLTVVGEETREGRRYALVNCQCGQQKYVLADALTSGRTRSCGARLCKYGHRASKARKRYIPRGSRQVPLDKLKLVYAAIHRKRDPLSIADAARKYGIENHNTLYSVLRAVRIAGGLHDYIHKQEL